MKALQDYMAARAEAQAEAAKAAPPERVPVAA
jgi:hypothetical protein